MTTPKKVCGHCNYAYHGQEIGDRDILCKRYPHTRRKDKEDWCGEFAGKLNLKKLKSFLDEQFP